MMDEDKILVMGLYETYYITIRQKDDIERTFEECIWYYQHFCHKRRQYRVHPSYSASIWVHM